MSVINETTRSGIIDRARSILLKPAETWNTIAAEPATARDLYRGYAVYLAAIPPLAGFIGGQVFGISLFGVTYHPPLIHALVSAVLQYVFALVGVYVLAMIIDALAPSFDGQKNRIQALKVAVYAYTASWVAGIFTLIPVLGLLAILGGLYSLYLLYLGLPKVMGAPQSKALGYTAVTVVVAIVISIVIGVVVGALGFGAAMSGMGNMTTTSSSSDGKSGTVQIGGATIDLDKLKEASKQMEAATQQMADAANGKSDSSSKSAVVPVSTDELKALLPASLDGYSRGDVSVNSGGVAGIGGSITSAEYKKDDGARFELSITDMGAVGSLTAIASAVGVESNKETATGYEKVGKIDGRMATEEWDRQSKYGKFGWVVANRFVVSAEGTGGDIADLKDAVKAVKPDDLTALTRK
jgi:hypothetical protein